MATVLVLLAGCAVAIFGVAFLVLFPVFSGAKLAARFSTCQSNAKQLGTALLMYAEDYDQKFPPAASWQDLITPYHKYPELERCPSYRERASGYAFNSLMNGRSLASVSSAVAQPLFFDSSAGRRNAADAVQSFAARHSSRGTVAFVDGHVKGLPVAPSADAGLKRRR